MISLSNTDKDFDKCKHMEITIENPNIGDIDELFYGYIIEHSKKHLENVIDDFKDKGYNFNHIEEMNIVTISNKTDMTYDLETSFE